MLRLKSVHTISALGGGLLLATALLLGGCSNKEESTPSKPAAKAADTKKAPDTKKPDEAKKPDTAKKPEAPAADSKKAEAPKPAPAKTLPADLSTKITEAKDFFTWYDLREMYTQAGITDEKIEQVLKKKETELLTANPPKAVTKGLDLVAFEWNVNGDPKVPGTLAKPAAKWLFKKSAPITISEDQEWVLYMRVTEVNDKTSPLHSFPDRFKEDKNKNKGKTAAFKFGRFGRKKVADSVIELNVGEYTLVQKETDIEIPFIPYTIETHFGRRFYDEDTKGWGNINRFTNTIDLGLRIPSER